MGDQALCLKASGTRMSGSAASPADHITVESSGKSLFLDSIGIGVYNIFRLYLVVCSSELLLELSFGVHVPIELACLTLPALLR